MPLSVNSRQESLGGGTAAFTLLEFLVAFTLMTLFLSAILAGLSIAIRRDAQASFMSRAVRLATARLAGAEADQALGPGTASGRSSDGLVWQARVEPYGRIALDGDRNVSGYWIEVTVFDPSRPSGRSVAVSGLEIRDEVRK